VRTRGDGASCGLLQYPGNQGFACVRVPACSRHCVATEMSPVRAIAKSYFCTIYCQQCREVLCRSVGAVDGGGVSCLNFERHAEQMDCWWAPERIIGNSVLKIFQSAALMFQSSGPSSIILRTCCIHCTRLFCFVRGARILNI
jgi:hypothetical protein